MKFIGLFGVCYFLILFSLNLIFPLFQNIYGIVGIAAFLTALILRMFMSLSEQIDQLEHELQLIKEKCDTENPKPESNDHPAL